MQELANANPIAENLKRLRTERGVTIEGLARTSKVSTRTILYIEGGNGNPRLNIIEALAAALGVPAVDLIATAV